MGFKEWAYLYTPRYVEELNSLIKSHKELNKLCKWEFYSYTRWIQSCFDEDVYNQRFETNLKLADMLWFDLGE